MSVAPIRSDSPHYTYTNPSNKFVRVDNNPNVRNGEYYAPFVYGSQGSKNPEFYKSPLTSVEIYRKTRSRNMPINDGPSHIVSEEPSKHGFCHNCDWKKILCCALIALALLALAVGLFFLIRTLLAKSDNRNVRTYIVPDTARAPTYTGINPVYVSPIPYSSMQVPTVSGYVASPNPSDGYNYVTSPSQTTSLKKQELSSSPTTSNPVTQPTIHWIPDPQNSYVNPLDVYKAYHD